VGKLITMWEKRSEEQYKKMAVLLHPDKNKCLGANRAFQIISEAWSFLSSEFKKSTFYYKRKKLYRLYGGSEE